MGEEKLIGLDIGDRVEVLHASLGEDCPIVSKSQLKELINTAFYASLAREEGRPVTFALILADDKLLRTENANRKDWSLLVFSERPRFSVDEVAKLAPAIDHRQTLLAVCATDDGKLEIAGLIRTNKMQHRFSRGELSSAHGYPHKSVVVTATDAGVVKIDLGSRRFASLARGDFLPEGVRIFDSGRIFEELCANAMGSALDVGTYIGILKRCLLGLVDRGHGGTVLVFPDTNFEDVLKFRHRAPKLAPTLQEAIHFSSGAVLGPTVYISKAGIVPDDAQIRELESARKRAVEEHEFLQDTASFAADLASIDGALVLLKDLTRDCILFPA